MQQSNRDATESKAGKTKFHNAVDYVTKPFNPVELLARVHTHVKFKRARQQYPELDLGGRRGSDPLQEDQE
jgi:DNA-binding response OmpR family regulator